MKMKIGKKYKILIKTTKEKYVATFEKEGYGKFWFTTDCGKYISPRINNVNVIDIVD